MAQRNLWHGFFEVLAASLKVSDKDLTKQQLVDYFHSNKTSNDVLEIEIKFGKLLTVAEQISAHDLVDRFDEWQLKLRLTT